MKFEFSKRRKEVDDLLITFSRLLTIETQKWHESEINVSLTKEEETAEKEVEDCNYINEEKIEDDSKSDYENLPEYCQLYIKGSRFPANFDRSLQKPNWYDERKFRRGQEFALTNYFGINFAELLSLFLIFSVKTALGPLIFTGKSSTPFSANQRYLSTINRVKSWYTGDPFDKSSMSHKNIKTVTNMHRRVRSQLTQSSPEDIKKYCSVGSEKCPVIWSTSRSVLREDFGPSVPRLHENLILKESGRIWLNQADMSATQFAFVGLLVTFPRKFGIFHNTDEDLDDFVYVWRVLGYLLGINDEFNFCSGGLAATRKRTHEFIDYVLKPSLRDLDENWEHMSRCLAAGVQFYMPEFTLEPCLLYLCDILEIQTPMFSKTISMWQSLMYVVLRFSFDYALKIPGMIKIFNRRVFWALKLAMGASTETLRKWKTTTFSYMKNDINSNNILSIK